jgi:hypothetical protein
LRQQKPNRRSGNGKGEAAGAPQEPHLKKGDIIMAHDYSKNYEYFEQHIKNKIWNWCEITETHIQTSSQINNLVPYMEDEFASVVWVCKIKQ